MKLTALVTLALALQQATSKIVWVDETVTKTNKEIITESLTIKTVYASGFDNLSISDNNQGKGLSRVSATSPVENISSAFSDIKVSESAKDSTSSTIPSSSSSSSSSTTSVSAKSGQTDGNAQFTTKRSSESTISTNDATMPIADIKSIDSTTSSTIFSSSASTVTSETGTIISTISTYDLTTPTITTFSSSLSVTLNPETISEDITISYNTTEALVSTSTTGETSESFLTTSLTTSSFGYQNSSSIDTSFSSFLDSSSFSTITTSSESTLTSSSIDETISTSLSTKTETSDTLSTSTQQETSQTSTFGDGSSFGVLPIVDLFNPIDVNSPPTVLTRGELDLEILSGVDNDGIPFETNKFYANLFLGDQTGTSFTYPYSGFLTKDNYYGYAVAHTDASSHVYGYYDGSSTEAQYYTNALKIGQLIFSATSFESSNFNLEVTEMKDMSVLVTLTDGTLDNYIDIPLVQGMGLNTAIYYGSLKAEINSQVGVKQLIQETSSALADGIIKYRATLYNDVEWLIYVTLPDGYKTDSSFKLTVSNPYTLVASESIDGLIIQVGVAPSSDDLDSYYDEAAGMYPISCSVKGNLDQSSDIAIYQFDYDTEGKSASGNTIVFALPHHVSSMVSATSKTATGISLDSSTKGKMYAFLTNSILLEETIDTNVQFLPYSADFISGSASGISYTSEQLKLIAQVANDELSVNIKDTVNSMTSTYYGGKVLDKYSYILLTVCDVLKDDDVTKSTLQQMKDAFATFTSNEQYYPLIYDTRYGGVTSSAYKISPDEDFGSGYYNDHHFHYGYFVHAAAVVGYVDAKYGGTWAEDNKDWVNSLIRDVANPSEEDEYFPVSRNFDWFNGHSWAAGLFVGYDGRNQESSSEDYNFAYGMKLWGKVIGDSSMEYRSDLMLAIMKRSMNMYYLYSDDNTVEPSQIISNKVAGILFDNKIDYTTYFGTNTEYIHGIHMLPITAASGLVRGSTFVQQEWEQKLSTLSETLTGGWASILRINQALYDPASSYNFFSSSSWDNSYLDNGQTRTWGLTFSAALLNAIS
ncbi:hypothetical protein B5S28_g2079 [[Candida] boidinii]|nr:hypothetical protein B5S28_g2079 [[Candida] boidinii]OWB62298.1 hypothetical protein B5S29_g3222 [[Candida] boidinii]